MWYDGWDDPNAVGSPASSRVSQLSVTFLHHMCGGGGGGAPRISLLVSWCMSCPGPGHHQLHCHQTGREWMDSKIWRVGCPGLGQPYQDIIFRTYLLHIHSTPTLMIKSCQSTSGILSTKCVPFWSRTKLSTQRYIFCCVNISSTLARSVSVSRSMFFPPDLSLSVT